MSLTKQELNNITGGGLSASLLNSISRGIKTIYDLGRVVGTSIRRSKLNVFCTI